MARLEAVDRQIGPAVTESLSDLDLSPQDKSVAILARKYAEAIDRATEEDLPDVLDALGPKLLRALDALCATPKSRALLPREEEKSGPSKLDNLRKIAG